MKGLIIASNGSGGGKTTFTMGLLKALVNRDEKVQSYKVGPDYIDPAFHSMITSEPCRNLDLYLMGEKGVKYSISNGNKDYAIIEGVMGLYDGKGIDEKYSTYHLSETLGLPILLVLSPKGVSTTICAEIMGLKEFRNANIAGVVLNGITESYYKLLKFSIEQNCGVNVLGYVPKDDRLKLGSRHLGLIQSSEVEDIQEKISLCGELVEKYVDVDAILSISKECKEYDVEYDFSELQGLNLKIGVALDKAFSFYYKDNLEILERAGEIYYFSPLKDKSLPEDIDFLYIGGGYPEVFKSELSSNVELVKDIKKKLEDGLPCYAECGGLMYLTEGIDSKEIKEFEDFKEENKLVSFFNGKSYMTKRLQNFGYATVEVGDKSPVHKSKQRINCHEFHKSFVDLAEETSYEVEKVNIYGELKKWKCGYVKKNTLGAYAHIHFLGNEKFIIEMLSTSKTQRQRTENKE